MGWVTLTLRKKELKSEHAYYQLRNLQISREKRQMARQKALDTSLFQLQERQATSEARQAYYSDRDDMNSKTSAMRQWAMLNNDLFEIFEKYNLNVNTASTPQTDALIADEEAKINSAQDNINTGTGKLEIHEAVIATAQARIAELEQEKPNEQISSTIGSITDGDDQDKANEIYQKIQALSYQPDSVTAGEAKVDSKDLTIDGESITDLDNALSQKQYEYQERNDEIKSYYETEYEMIEAEAADREMDLDQEQTDVEAQMEAISQEMQAVSDAISSQIQSSTIKLA